MKSSLTMSIKPCTMTSKSSKSRFGRSQLKISKVARNFYSSQSNKKAILVLSTNNHTRLPSRDAIVTWRMRKSERRRKENFSSHQGHSRTNWCSFVSWIDMDNKAIDLTLSVNCNLKFDFKPNYWIQRHDIKPQTNSLLH